MDVRVPEGKYILAVSGGVDSMVLLDVLSRQKGIELVVAHFNHGIRSDSLKDENLVAEAAGKYKLEYVVGRAKLGPNVSEAAAREARYKFLKAVKKRSCADKIITAHHQDDLIETAVLNILRGTGRRGLSSIANNPEVYRPLLNVPKNEIVSYAKKNRIKWREDSTNSDDSYLRNYLRQHVLKDITPSSRRLLLENTQKITEINKQMDVIIATLSQSIYKDNKINRGAYISLPLAVERELLIYWLRTNNINLQDRREIEHLVTVLKTAAAGTRHDVHGPYKLVVGKREAHLCNTLGP